MNKVSLLSLVIMMLAMTSCEAIGDIFSAGFYTGIILVVGVIILIVWFVTKRR
jgi:TRAP-type C4-dicarboxylate transport system permease large subunit